MRDALRDQRRGVSKMDPEAPNAEELVNLNLCYVRSGPRQGPVPISGIRSFYHIVPYRTKSACQNSDINFRIKIVEIYHENSDLF
jgi:hypothetical protein